MNKIRKWFAAKVEQLMPVLHETYRRVGLYQKQRTARSTEQLLQQLAEVDPLLRFFAEHVPGPKRPFFAAIGDASLPLSDRIIALDTAVGALHIEFAMPRAYMHPVSRRLREALEAAREWEGDGDARPSAQSQPDVLARGIPASPGVAVGRAFIVRRNADYRHVPKDAVVVASMTRPELALSPQRPAAIVTDIGGSLCHAAIIARELGIPAVVGTGNATQVIRDRDWVRVDGTSGEVKASVR